MDDMLIEVCVEPLLSVELEYLIAGAVWPYTGEEDWR
jgi:hypothetical protein